MMEQKGLTISEVSERRQIHGLNELKDVNRTSPWKILFRQVKNNFVIYLLVVAAILSFVVEKGVTGYTLLFIIGLVIILGFFQEYRAEKATNALKQMIAPISIVIRDGRQQEVLSRELVPGDLLILRPGERIPADCIILEATELKANESILTGESAEVEKAKAPSLAASDNKYRLYMGTYVVHGKALAQVLDIGMKTRFGSIAGMISKEEKALPLQDKINHLSKRTVLIALFYSVLVGLIQLSYAKVIAPSVLIEVAIVMIALAVAAFPESFPVVLMTTLSAGAYRMAHQNAIVNRMSVIETLGETTVICSDKTGTLTKGEMTAKAVVADGTLFSISGIGYSGDGSFFLNEQNYDIRKNSVLSRLCEAAVLCNDASITRSGEDLLYQVTGTPTEAALLVMGAKAGIHSGDLKSQRISEIPFSSERKLMSVLTKQGKDSYLYAKGAPEVILARCSKIQRSNGVFTLTKKEKDAFLGQIKSLNARAYRTLGFAYKTKASLKSAADEKDLILLGLVALEDPPREEVVAALAHCTRAGISVKMITGDNQETAISIAAQIGLSGPVLTGAELDTLSDEALVLHVKDTTIFARVRPEHKLRIVNALKASGEIVTMTGDGVNDAPALKAAHIGVAMGKSGTDVSRSVADITLKDDNFATIVKAIREGRTIFNNMRKFVTYQFSCTYAEIMIIFLAVVFGLPLPLVAIQILFMNLVTSDFPAITLGLNPSSDDVMAHKPRRKSHILTRDHIQMLIIGGMVIGLGTLGIYLFMLNTGSPLYEARTAALISLILFEVIGAFSFRSFRKATFGRSLFTNKYLVYTSLISILATIGIIYTPLNVLFETVPVGWDVWVLALVPSILLIALFDVLKALNNKMQFWKDVS